MPGLVRALADPEPLVRGHAAWALGRIGGAEARRALLGPEATTFQTLAGFSNLELMGILAVFTVVLIGLVGPENGLQLLDPVLEGFELGGELSAIV